MAYGNPGVNPAFAGPAQRLVAKRTTVPTRTGSVAPQSSLMSAQEWARKEAQRYIDELVKGIEAQRSTYLSELDRRSQLEAQRGEMLAKALMELNIPSTIQGIYGDAGKDITGYAGGFSGALRDTALADTAAQTRMVSGTGQEAAVRNQGENMGNVLYGSQGYVPARAMAETGAAFASQAALEPGFAARMGAINAANAYQEGLGGLDEFSKALVEAVGKKPELVNDLLKQYNTDLTTRQKIIDSKREAELDIYDRQYKQAKDTRDYWLKQQYLYLAQGRQDLSEQAAARAQEQLELMQQAEQRRALAQQGYDTEGNLLPGFRRNPKTGVVEKIPTPAKPKAKPTAQEKANAARKERETEFAKLKADAVKQARALIPKDTLLRKATPPPYAVAFRKLWNLYKDWLRFAPAKGPGHSKARARLTEAINAALAVAGITPPNG